MKHEIYVLIVIVAMIFAGFTSFIADEKGYSAKAWFILGFLFPIVALIAAAGLPKKS